MNRDEILRRFEACLDDALEREEPLPGIAAEILNDPEPHGGDLYSMQAAITALTQEIKLQSRGFKQLSEALAPPDETPRAAERRARREMLGIFIDLRDRLQRGLRGAQEVRKKIERRPAGWVDRLLRRPDPGKDASEVVTALEKGYALTASRLNEAMDRLRVREIEAEGQAFDTARMTAVDLEETGAAREGTVLEVYRPGYEWEGEIFRAAEVKVARAPRSNGE